MMKRLKLLPIAVVCLTAIASASIERLTLRQMVERADDAVFGEIIEREVTAVPLERDGEEMYFTTLHVRGQSVLNGKQVTVTVSYPGGVLNKRRGSFNSEAPSADDVALGGKVLVFYKWSDNMGGGFAANALYASHGGLFKSFKDKQGRVVVKGRGKGYAVPKNLRLTQLETDARKYKQDHERKQRER
jgi:hypothetical protein